MTGERVLLRNPDPAKAGPNIEREKYTIARDEILGLVPRTAPGITWTELRDRAEKSLAKKLRGGNSWWYTSVVKLHLEAIGELKRSGGSPQRLTRIR
jgi:hypothetical protein